MKQRDIKKVFERDNFRCWHCGIEDGTLILHHRLNRGIGGSKERDTLANVILVCARYNGLMESDSWWAARAREQGHKLLSWQKPDQAAVFDVSSQEWYLLDDLGNRLNVEDK